MDRSTEITIRSAIIIASMILVPLWAVLGTSWTTTLHTTPLAENAVPAKARPTKRAAENQRPAPSLVAVNEAPRLPLPNVASQASPGPVTAVTTLPAATAPVANTPLPPVQSATPPPAPVVQHVPPVTPPPQPEAPTIHIRSFDGRPVPQSSEVASRIASDSGAASPNVQPTVAVSSPPSAAVAAVPVEPTPALVTAGDWFQWTESKLRELGASQFILESNGEQGYRFRCKAPLPADPGFTRHFEATGETALAAMQDALRQIDAWRRNVR